VKHSFSQFDYNRQALFHSIS